jgi:arylsulfotransferase ASST
MFSYRPLRFLSKHFILVISFLIPVFVKCLAEIHPANGEILNRIQVMFEYDEVPNADQYLISIESTDAAHSFHLDVKNKSLACLVSNLQFGQSYQWHYVAYDNKKQLFQSEVFHFTINRHYLVDTNLYRSKIEISKNGFNNDIIFLDFLGIAIDRTGKPVWFYPFNSEDGRSEPNFRNLRMTNMGTITFQTNDDCFETGIDGNVLWKAPNDGLISGEKREFYHHDFRRLNDGSYLTTSYKYVMQPNYFDTTILSRVRYNTLIQYDASGRVIWSWNEKDHVDKSVLFQRSDVRSTEVEGTHLNGFDYDEKQDAVVMSFRNNSSIIKIDKSTGKIIYNLAEYGAESGNKNPWFARQHGPVILPNHRLLVYDNNVFDTINGVTYPKVLIIAEPENYKSPQILWEFECKSDKYPKGITGKEGYALPLPNGNIFVCMGGANFAFEVTPAKEIVWECYFEKLDPQKNNWIGFNNYRCNSSSSLYPKYYTMQSVENSKKNFPSFQLNNEGTDEDYFRIDGLSQDGRTKYFTTFINLKGRTSKLITLPVNPERPGEDVIVSVSTLSSPNFSKLLTIKRPEKK